MRKNIVSYSGGKDSTALLLYCLQTLNNFDAVFCDTKWEHPLVYAYIESINDKLLDGKLKRLYSEEYDGFYDLCIKKKRVPSAKARFCTEQLKVLPMKNYLETIQEGNNLFVYQGIRKDESYRRSLMKKNVFDADLYKATIKRPLFNWTAEQVFEIHKKHNVEPNPLYKMGMKRVGCMPCVMVTLPEIRNIFAQFDEIKGKLLEIEQKLGRTFFPPNYIPDKYCSITAEVETPIKRYIIEPPLFCTDEELKEYNKPENIETVGVKKVLKKVPSVEDVARYVKSDPDRLIADHPDVEGETCMSYYSLCE